MGLVKKTFGEIITFTRASGGGRFNASGQYEWLPANQPRFDFDPVTGEAKGLLIEEKRTNLLTYSSDFSNAVWTKRGTLTVTPNAALSPDGTLSAPLVTGLNSSANDIYRQGINSGGLAAESRYEPSIYLKKVTQTGIVNISNPYTPSYGDWAVDLSKVGNGWERITRSHPAVTVAVEFKTHTTGYLGIQLRKTTAGEVSLYIWGAQLEAGSSPSSYIPTTNAQVTRAASDPLLQTLSPWFNQSAGTFIIEHDAVAGRPLLSSGSYLLASSAGPGKTVLAYDASGSYVSQNGGAFAAGPPPTFGDSLRLMRSATQWANAHCKSLRYYPRRLTLAEASA
jgi:hypothetical protein